MTDIPVGVTVSDDATEVGWWHQLLLPSAGLMRALSSPPLILAMADLPDAFFLEEAVVW